MGGFVWHFMGHSKTMGYIRSPDDITTKNIVIRERARRPSAPGESCKREKSELAYSFFPPKMTSPLPPRLW